MGSLTADRHLNLRDETRPASVPGEARRLLVTPTRVLFLAEDERVVVSLKDAFSNQRERVDAHFVESADLALDMLSKITFDAVVAGVRADGMDGLTFLRYVKERHPQIARFVADRDGAADGVQASTVAHQVIGREADPADMLAAVTRSVQVRNMLGRPELVKVMTGANSVPSMPHLYWRLTDELSSDDVSLAAIGDIVAAEPGMAIKVLQMVNSAFFGLRREIVDVRQAVSLLGADTIAALVLTVHVFTHAPRDGAAGEAMQALWVRSLGVATSARALAGVSGASAEVVEASYVSGLIHACGRVMLATNWPDRFIGTREGSEADIAVAERNEFGASGEEVGAYLVSLWGLPDDVVEAVAFSISPSVSGDRQFSPLTAVHVARCFESGSGKEGLDTAYLEAAGVTHEIDRWAEAHANELYQREHG